MSVPKYTEEFVSDQIKYVTEAKKMLYKIKKLGINPTFAEIEYTKARSILDMILDHNSA